MTELEILTQNNESLINARDLWLKLGVKTKFNDWINRRIKNYSFELNEDYSKLSTPIIGGFRTDYFLTLDMAKELCLVENNEKGRSYRKYLIMQEKKVKYLLQENIKLKEELFNEQQKTLDVLIEKKIIEDSHNKPVDSLRTFWDCSVKKIYKELESKSLFYFDKKYNQWTPVESEKHHFISTYSHGRYKYRFANDESYRLYIKHTALANQN